MKKLLIKVITFIMILFTFTGCYTLSKTYYYETKPMDKFLKNYFMNIKRFGRQRN